MAYWREHRLAPKMVQSLGKCWGPWMAYWRDQCLSWMVVHLEKMMVLLMFFERVFQ
jgi:hypothetical protein